jgi:acetyl-CoA carboxylase biotin carboxyl carrier protein
MDLDQLTHILELFREHELSELEVEQDGLRLRARKDRGVIAVAPAPPAGVPAPPVVAPPPVANALTMAGVEDTEIELAVVKSPIVGTFYSAPEPGAPAFVDIGSTVKKGQVLCIIEAMKLMNEIDSEYEGEIVNVYVENGQPVQYGERLFAIRTK